MRGTCASEDTLQWIGGLTNPGAVITYKGWTYWADNTANSVSRARYPSTDVEVVVTGVELPSLLAVDATHLYVASSNNIAGTIYRATLGGNAPAELVTLTNQPSGLVVDDANIHWASSDGVFALPKTPGESTADAGRPLVFEAVGPRSYSFYLACGHLDYSWDFQGTHIGAVGLHLYDGISPIFLEKGGYLYVPSTGSGFSDRRSKRRPVSRRRAD